MLNVLSAPITFQSSENQTTLLELYTSEGCSSCPPAEAWLSRLKDSPDLWKGFVPVAFHVDYWDYLGWRDPWSAKSFSERQRDYASQWRSDSIYTPGFVLNGKEWRNWSTSKEPRTTQSKVGILSGTLTDSKSWLVTFTPASYDKNQYSVHAALLANDLTSDVKAGENRGKRLHHDFIVTALAAAPLKGGNSKLTAELTFAPAKNPSSDTSKRVRFALAVWITRGESLEPLQAAGGWLP